VKFFLHKNLACENFLQLIFLEIWYNNSAIFRKHSWDFYKNGGLIMMFERDRDRERQRVVDLKTYKKWAKFDGL